MEKLTQNPPKGFPESLCDPVFLHGLRRADIKTLELSDKAYDIAGFIAELQEWLT